MRSQSTIPVRTRERGPQVGRFSGWLEKTSRPLIVRTIDRSAEATMRHCLKIVSMILVLVALQSPLAFSQGRGGGRGAGGGQGRGQAPARPAPRYPDGQIILGQIPGDPPVLWDAGPTNIPLARPDK